MATLPSIRLIPLAAALALAGAAPALSGHTGVNGVFGYPVFLPPGGTPAPAAPASPAAQAAAAEAVAEAISQANRVCGQTGAYVIDCLAERLEQATRGLAPTGELAEAKAVLETAARELSALARNNRDGSLARGRIRQGDSVISSRLITPVDQARLSELAAAAAGIVEAAETQLLRSSAGATPRAAQYQRIAAVVGSTKVLLRSS